VAGLARLLPDDWRRRPWPESVISSLRNRAQFEVSSGINDACIEIGNVSEEPTVYDLANEQASGAQQSGHTLTEALPAVDHLQWYAVYTKSRHEKVAQRGLEDKGIESFLPLRDVLSQWKDRRKWVQKPLFPGYLFVRTEWSELGDVTSVRGVAYVLGNQGKAAPVPEEQLLTVRRMVEGPYEVMPWPWLSKGKRVLVTSGPLAGLETYIVRRNRASRCHLVVSVDLLGRSVAVEVDPRCVELIP